MPSRFFGFFKKGRLFENPSATICTLVATLRVEIDEKAAAVEIMLRMTINADDISEILMLLES